MENRIIMLVDLDYFFAQVEEMRNPHIRGKPIVVCVYSGRSEDSGAVSTANYIAREYGVKSGISIALAKKRLQDTEAVFLSVDHAFYEEVSEKIMNILREFADRFEQVGIDEAYLDVSQKVNANFEKAESLALRIKEEVKTRQNLTCSIGVGPNKLVAKIAADIQKPDGLTIVESKQVESFLASLPVNRLVGVGIKTQERMQGLAIETIGDLAKYDVQKLVDVFGKSLGMYFHNASLGIDYEPVQERGEITSISRISTLKEDTNDIDEILVKAYQLCNEVHAELLQRELSFKTLGIVAIMVDLSSHSRSKTFENPTNDPVLLREAAKELFGKFVNEFQLKIRRIGVKITGFVREEKSQKKLTSFFG